MISIGGTRQKTTATFSATSQNLEPVNITLDELAVGDRYNSYFIDYHYRFKPNWSVFAGTFQFLGRGENVSERDINYDGVEFTTGSELNSEFDIDVYILDIMYTVHRSEKIEIMLGAGIHALDLAVKIDGSASVDDQSSDILRASSSLLAPVPNLRGSATWSVSDNFGFSLIAGWLSANVDEYSGDFAYAHLRAHYQITEGLGASLGYQMTNIDIGQERTRSDLTFDMQLDGPTLTLSYSF